MTLRRPIGPVEDAAISTSSSNAAFGWLDAIVARLRTLDGWRRLLAAFILGAVMVLAMPPFDLWPLLFGIFPALVLLLDAANDSDPEATAVRRAVRAAVTGWAFGFGYFVVGLYWIGEAFLVEADKFAWLLPLAVTLLPAGLALFFALGCGAASLVWRIDGTRVFALALALGASEWLRGNILTGFPWMVLGYGLTGTAATSQLASLIGVEAMSFLAVVLYASPVLWLAGGPSADGARGWARLPFAALAVLVAVAAWGGWRLATSNDQMIAGVRLRLVQPNIPQKEKWLGANRQRIFETFLALSRQSEAEAAAADARITHVLWPESSVPFLLMQSSEGLQAIANLLPDDDYLITGSLRMETRLEGDDAVPVVFNSLAALDGGARLVGVYDKRHLVPFGEYLPFQSALEAIGLEQLTRLKGGFSAGITPQRLEVPGLPLIAPLICYEAIFPHTVASGVGRPGLILNATNDAWFGASFGPLQHLAQARLRAIEEGLPLVRVANTGVSAIIDPHGRLLTTLGLEQRGVIDSGLPAALPPTLYARFGDWMCGAVAFVLAGLWLGMRRKAAIERTV